MVSREQYDPCVQWPCESQGAQAWTTLTPVTPTPVTPTPSPRPCPAQAELTVLPVGCGVPRGHSLNLCVCHGECLGGSNLGVTGRQRISGEPCEWPWPLWNKQDQCRVQTRGWHPPSSGPQGHPPETWPWPWEASAWPQGPAGAPGQTPTPWKGCACGNPSLSWDVRGFRQTAQGTCHPHIPSCQDRHGMYSFHTLISALGAHRAGTAETEAKAISPPEPAPTIYPSQPEMVPTACGSLASGRPDFSVSVF